MNNRAGELRHLWHVYNEEVFGSKLTEPVIRVDNRLSRVDGYFEHSWSERHGKRIPGRSRVIRVAGHAADEDPNGTLLHEMIHQYQFEVMLRECSHDAIFNSIARKCERLYGVSVR